MLRREFGFGSRLDDSNTEGMGDLVVRRFSHAARFDPRASAKSAINFVHCVNGVI
jgi:hypothetical protein